jgi:hypothetical protein
MANMPVPGWNAHRYPQEPLRQPAYLFSNVPKCAKDLKSSVIQEINDRDQFKEAMAEMVLLCNEAIRRTSAQRSSSKPLSLEYIADRVDVDDPCFGYLVRSQEGMLQGFITVTTFTNWQKSFRWDSLHELAFYYDDSDDEDDEQVRHRPKRERSVDRDGQLAMAMENTVRLGDPYNEGIVWPRIAEISLLGGLGCGKALVQLVVEDLEAKKASGTANYDYVILQATDNSIPFYESQGFSRVGAVTEDPAVTAQQQLLTQEHSRSENPVASGDKIAEAIAAEPVEASSKEDQPDAIALPGEIVSSPHIVYEVTKAGESPNEIAKQMQIEVWDIIFMNKDIYKDICSTSKLMKGTILHLPKPQQITQGSRESSPTKWFVAKENDTPRKIAKKFGMPCKHIVDANLNRLPELQAASRLKEGTRVKVSNLDKVDDIAVPYCHWTFPDDDSVEGGEPSYMMVRTLNRKGLKHPRPIHKSLSASIAPYSPAPLLVPPPPGNPEVEVEPPTKVEALPKKAKKSKKHKGAPKRPQDPPTGFDIFRDQQQELDHSQTIKQIEEQWRNLSEKKQNRYTFISDDIRSHFDRQMEEYDVEYSLWKEMVEQEDQEPPAPKIVVNAPDESLFSKVVKLRDDALDGKDYLYWYVHCLQLARLHIYLIVLLTLTLPSLDRFVLTYIPDLKWCHLAPMVQDGVFGPESKRSQGRPKWRLVDETFGHELDISSTFCISVKSKTMKKTADADEEEWDVLDEDGFLKSCDVPIGDCDSVISRAVSKQPLKARSAIKPMGGKITKKPKFRRKEETYAPTPTLVASPAQSTRSQGSPHIPGVYTPPPRSRRALLTSPASPMRSPSSTLPFTSPKRKGSTDDFLTDSNPARKARKVNSAGARRSVLQN